jgi:hypothetical protein
MIIVKSSVQLGAAKGKVECGRGKVRVKSVATARSIAWLAAG